MKKLITAAAITLGALTIAPAIAEAHHTTTTCTDRQTSTWTIVNSENRPMTFTTNRGHSGAIGPRGTTTVVYNGTSITVSGLWNNGQTNTSTGTGQCVPEVVETTTTTTTTTTTIPETTTTTTIPEETTTTTEAPPVTTTPATTFPPESPPVTPPTPEAPPVVETGPPPTPPAPPATPPAGAPPTLPETGSSSTTLALLAAAFIAGGSTLVARARRA